MKEWKEYLFKVNGFEMTAVYNEDTIRILDTRLKMRIHHKNIIHKMMIPTDDIVTKMIIQNNHSRSRQVELRSQQ